MKNKNDIDLALYGPGGLIHKYLIPLKKEYVTSELYKITEAKLLRDENNIKTYLVTFLNGKKIEIDIPDFNISIRYL